MSRIIRSVLFVSAILAALTTWSQNNITNRGRDFWVGYGHHQFMEQGGNDQDMVIYLSAEDQPATVTITIDSSGLIPALWWSRTYTIPAYTVISIENPLTPATSWTPASAPGPGRSYGPIPKGPINAVPAETNPNFDARLYTDPPPAGTGGAGIFRKRGIHIQSNVPIVAYAHIYGSASSGATMLLPVEAWGYSYISINSEQSYASNCYSWMYVIAQRDNTVIEVTPSTVTRAQDRTGLLPGVPSLITLNKGQIYQIIGANDGADANGNGGSASTGRQLSGTKVRSLAGAGGQCFPIAVFSGSSRTSNPISCGSGGGDNDNQQLFPTHAWGKQYLTAPFSGSSTASSFANSMYKIVVKDPTTQVKLNGTTLTGMNPAGYYTFESNSGNYIEADKPIQVAQFMTGGNCLGAGGGGDPEMIILSPLEQATKRVGFYRNIRENIGVNYLTLVIPTAGVASLRIDNSSVFTHTYPHPRKAGYTVVIKQWSPSAQAQCIAYSDSAFNAITYGLGSVESYGYNAGTNVNNLNAIGSVHNQLDASVAEHPFTCTNTPVELSVLMAYQPTQLVWNLSALSGVLSPSTNVTQAPPALTGTVVVDGNTYYKYTLPGTYMFSQADTFEVSILATSPVVDNCNNTEEIKINYIVKDKPKPDFNITHSGCTLDTVYFAGLNLAGGGFTLGQWNWTFPGPTTATGQNVKKLLPPGNHNITLNGISSEGCVGDTIKTITVHPKPTATFGISNPAVCLGQQITFSDTSVYAGTPGIINWYWDLGEGTLLNNPTAANVVKNYGTANTYTVRHAVKVTDLCVSDTISKIVTISPEALISFTYPTNCLPVTGVAQFTASATDLGGVPITSYNWNFGDPGSGANNTSTAQNPAHTYTAFNTYPVTLTFANNTGCTGDTTVNLQFSTLPALAYAPAPNICVNAAPVSVANGSVTNGVTGTFEYHGPGTSLTGMFDPAVAGAGPHTIWYVFTANGGCKDSISITVTVTPLPAKPVATTPVSYCQNATAVALSATALPGHTLTWFNNQALTGGTTTAPVPSTTATGTFYWYVNQTDPATGCTSDTSRIAVIILPGITGNAIGADQTICGGTSPATLTATGTLGGGTGTYTYQWQQSTDGGATWTDIAGATGVTLTPAAVAGAIQYRRVVNDGLCSSTSNVVTITVQGTLASFNISAAQTICEATAPALLDGQTPVGGSGTFIYQWESSPDGTTWTAIAGATAEDYQPPVLTSNMCYRRNLTSGVCSAVSNVVCITVNPRPNGTIATTTTAICSYDAASVSFTANAGTAPFNVQVTVAGPAGTNTITQTVANNGPATINVIPTGSAAGTYTITLANITDANGCSRNTGMTTLSINVTAQPVLTISPAATICQGSSATLTVSGATTYSWSPATGLNVTTGASVIATPLSTTTYTVTGSTNGCTNTTTVTVNVNPIPGAPLAVTPVNYCQGDAATALSATPDPGHTLMWYDNAALTGGTPAAPTPLTSTAGTFNYYVTQTNGFGCTGPSSVITITVIPSIASNTLAADQQICAGNVPAAFTASTPTGGSGTFAYQWQQSTDGGATWTNIPAATAANYTPGALNTTTQFRRVVTSGLCTNTSNTIVITVLTTITNFNISASQTICEGSAPALLDGQTPVGTGTLTFQWESSPNGATWTAIAGATAEDYQPGTLTTTTHYRRKVSNSVCDVFSVPVIITVNPKPQATITGPTAVCAYDGASVSFTASAGTAPFTVQLTVAGPAGTNTITQTVANNGPVSINVVPVNSAAGNYTITLSNLTDNNGCNRNTGMTSLTIAVTARPVVTINPAATAICEGGSTVLAASGAATYEWSPATGLSATTGGSVTANPTTTTTYQVIGTTNACNGTATVTVTVNPRPLASFTATSSICAGQLATITNTSTGNIATWNWDLGNGTTPSYTNGNPFTVQYTSHNDYTVQLVAVSPQGCSSLPATRTVGVHALPVVNFNLPAGICMPGGVAAFTNQTTIPDNAAMTYLWDFDDAGTTSTAVNPTHTYGVAGTYNVTLTATSSFGCVNQNAKPLSDFYDKPVAYFQVTPNEICQGADVVFDDQSTAPNSSLQSWSWNFDDNTTSLSEVPTKKFSKPGEFDVELVVTNAVGCKSDPFMQKVTVHLQPVIDAGQSFVVPQGSTIQFTATANSPGLTFSWNPPAGLSSATVMRPTLVATKDETYTLTATGDFGCTAQDVITVKILKPVQVPNVFSPNGDNIHDKWLIPNLIDYQNCTVEIFNRYGQQVFYSIGYNKPWDGTIKGKDLPVGTYYYVIELKNGFKPITGSITIVR
jgi:gliding motility-associated-like protein